jgi:hypothetical protein
MFKWIWKLMSGASPLSPIQEAQIACDEAELSSICWAKRLEHRQRDLKAAQERAAQAAQAAAPN